jgi:hypothetical protein
MNTKKKIETLKALQEAGIQEGNVFIFSENTYVQSHCVNPQMHIGNAHRNLELEKLKSDVESKLDASKMDLVDKFSIYFMDEVQRYRFVYQMAQCDKNHMNAAYELIARLLMSPCWMLPDNVYSPGFLGMVSQLMDVQDNNSVDRLRRGAQRSHVKLLEQAKKQSQQQ